MKKGLKTITCPCCNGLGEFMIRDYHGTVSSNPSITRRKCHYCNGLLHVRVSEDWTKEYYMKEVREKINGVTLYR